MLTITSGKRSAPVSCGDKGRSGCRGLVLVLVGNQDPCEDHIPRTNRGASRTGTRPLPIPSSTPCPYRTGVALPALQRGGMPFHGKSSDVVIAGVQVVKRPVRNILSLFSNAEERCGLPWY